MSVHIHCLPSSLLSSTNNFKNYSHPFEKAFPAENYQTLPHLPWSFGFYLSSHWTVPPLLIQFLLTPSFSLFPIGFPTAWFDWKSCVIRSCLFCWLYITICVLYCQLFCEIFLFFLFIIYLYSNCVYFIFKYVFLTESLKCKKHGKNPDNTVPSSLRFHRFPPLPAHMSCALLQLLTQQISLLSGFHRCGPLPRHHAQRNVVKCVCQILWNCFYFHKRAFHYFYTIC